MDEEKNQHLVLLGKNVSEGGRGTDESAKKNGGHNKDKETQEEEKQGAKNWTRAQVTPDRTTRGY